MKTFPELVKDELGRANEMHGGDIASLHEGLGIIREEYIEFEQEVFKKVRKIDDVLSELVQIAAMCQKVAEGLEIVQKGQKALS